MKYGFPKGTPDSVREFLKRISSVLSSILMDGLVGIYLYGSLAMGCFNPELSDIDILIVVEGNLSREKSGAVLDYLKRVCSKERRVELSVMNADILQKPTYPIMVCLHYEYWGETFENQKDNEILSNLYTTKKRGFCVWGAPISEMFSKIPAEYHLRAIIEDIMHTKKHLHESSESIGYNIIIYWVLGSCRILAFIRDGEVLSKAEGGKWGLTNLPREYHDLLRQALSCYQGKKKDAVWNKEKLDAFAHYMSSTILRESKQQRHLAQT